MYKCNTKHLSEGVVKELKNGFEQAFGEMCFHCFGSGELKAMQRAMLFGGGSVRGNDATVKCTSCNGTGRCKTQ